MMLRFVLSVCHKICRPYIIQLMNKNTNDSINYKINYNHMYDVVWQYGTVIYRTQKVERKSVAIDYRIHE